MTTMELERLAPNHPARPLDARWKVALSYTGWNSPLPEEEWIDDWVRRTVSYLGHLRQCKTDAEKRRVRKGMPDIAFAIRLHEHKDRMRRAVPEARFLAGQSVEEVAAACKMPVQGVAAYEALFYRLVGRLDRFIMISFQAFGNYPGEPITLQDKDVVLKILAHKGGPIYLDAILDYFLHGLKFPKNSRTATSKELTRLYRGLGAHALFLLKALPWPDCLVSERIMEIADEVEEMRVCRFETNGFDEKDRSSLFEELRAIGRRRRYGRPDRPAKAAA